MAHEHYSTDCLCFQTRRADRLIMQIYDSFIRKSGLKSTQYALLRCIANLDEPSVSDISRNLAMDQTTVSRNIKLLQQKGLVTTEPSPADPRRINISLTSLGQSALKAGEAGWLQAQNAVKEKIGDKKFMELNSLLDSVSRILE